MKEREFIEQNKQNWTDFEKKIKEGDWEPESISRHYTRTIDDLSFARSHYPNRLVRYYLNGVIQVLSLKIYRSQSHFRKGMRKFWGRDLPLVMHEARYEFLLSFLILAISVGIGVVSSMSDDSFASFILGEAYVEQTLENIDSGDPMAIYKSSGQTEMFFGITYNNIMVSAYTYALSLFFGAGTLMVIIYNGVMLGVFQYFFYERGLFFESFLTIWQHGVVEISCIVLAGTAGLVLARGLLFPGTFSRLDAFRYAGRKSLIIMLGLMPLLVYSGAIEAAVTRYTEMHWAIRLSTILLSLGFVLGYFVFFARRVARQYDISTEMNMYIQPMKPFSFSYDAIEKSPPIIWKALGMLIANRRRFFTTGLGLSLLVCVIFALGVEGFKQNYGVFYTVNFYATDFQMGKTLSVFFINLSSIVFGNWLIWQDRKSVSDKIFSSKKFFVRTSLFASIVALIVTVLMTRHWLVLVLIAALPLLGLFAIHSWYAKLNVYTSLKASIELLSKNYFRPVGLVLILFFMTILLNFFLQNFGWDLLSQLAYSFFGVSERLSIVLSLLSISISVLILYCFNALIFASVGLSLFTLSEVNNATALRQRISHHFPDVDASLSENTGLLASNKLFR